MILEKNINLKLNAFVKEKGSNLLKIYYRLISSSYQERLIDRLIEEDDYRTFLSV